MLLTKPVSSLWISLALVAHLAGTVGAQEPAADRRARARARWEQMDESERQLFRERMERLRNMGAEERSALEDRAAALERRKEERLEELNPEARRRLDALAPEQRARVLRQYFDECERFRGLRLREQMPPEFLKQLESVPPEERRAMLRQFQQDMRAEAGDRLLDQLRRATEVSPDEIEGLDRLGERERRRALLELKRGHIRRRVEATGLPPWVTEEEWRELDALPLEEFMRRWGHRREPEPEPGLDGGPPPVPGESARDGRPGGPPGPPGIGRRFERGPGRLAEGRGRLVDRLSDLARPTLEDLLERDEHDEASLREVLSARIRERCLEFLDANPLLEDAELERLRALSGTDFVREIRAFLGRQGGPRWGCGKR